MIWVFKLSQYDSIRWHYCKDQDLNYLMIDILFEEDRCINAIVSTACYFGLPFNLIKGCDRLEKYSS